MPKSVFSKKYDCFRNMLLQARRDAGLTQMGVAVKLERPQSFVSKYECGERRLDLVEFLEIASVLKINPAAFVKRLEKQFACIKNPS